jgi:general secretion pathway protein C
MLANTMSPKPHSIPVILVTLGVWLLLGMSLVVWTLKLWPYGSSQPVASGATPLVQTQHNQPNPQKLASLLGAEPQIAQKAPDVALARLTLAGLVHAHGDQGVALISIDKQSPKPYPVGSRVGDTLILHSVQEHSVSFRLATIEGKSSEQGAADTFLMLELPKPSRAQPSPKSTPGK